MIFTPSSRRPFEHVHNLRLDSQILDGLPPAGLIPPPLATAEGDVGVELEPPVAEFVVPKPAVGSPGLALLASPFAPTPGLPYSRKAPWLSNSAIGSLLIRSHAVSASRAWSASGSFSISGRIRYLKSRRRLISLRSSITACLSRACLSCLRYHDSGRSGKSRSYVCPSQATASGTLNAAPELHQTHEVPS